MTHETSMEEIFESLRAIKVAARDRHVALRSELAKLEEAFPELVEKESSHRGRPRGGVVSAAHRARLSQSMKERWERAKAAGQNTVAAAAH